MGWDGHERLKGGKEGKSHLQMWADHLLGCRAAVRGWPYMYDLASYIRAVNFAKRDLKGQGESYSEQCAIALSTCAPGAILHTLRVLTHSILTTGLSGRYCFALAFAMRK